MIITIGEYTLAATLLVSVAILLTAVAHIRLNLDGAVRAARFGMALLALLLTVSSACLLYALLQDNFSVSYIARHSERALPLGYKIAAFWAGQEGSLLFWAFTLSLMGLILAFSLRKKDTTESILTLAIMAAVIGFFALLMLFAGNPFELGKETPADGHGLNPILQNIAMVIHPPILFLGYAGFTAPFAILLAALLTGRKDPQWASALRPWVIASWLFLSAGILLGAQWAYVELGWGGYWAWDPVENASLLPWLTGTALLHSIALVRRRGMFKRWTAFLTAASFLLCIFGTYLTRSGVIQSVHSFGESPIGTFFLTFLAITTFGSLALILFRLKLLTPDHPLDNLLSREGLFLAANVLLVAMTLATIVGTTFPLLSAAFGAKSADGSQGLSVSAPYYNNIVLPLGLALAAIMACGPTLGHSHTHGTSASPRAKKMLFIMAAVALLSAAALAFLGFASGWALASAAVAAAVLTGVILDFSFTTLQHARNSNPFSAALHTLLATPHRWGAQVTHLGVAAMIVGIAGSSLYNINETQPLKTGESANVGGYSVTYLNLQQIRRTNHTAVVATVQLTGKSGQPFTLQPERRFYDKCTEMGQSASEVAIRFGLRGDVYLNLAGWEDDGKTATIQVILNPLVNWIWIGGFLLAIGSLMCFLPQRRLLPVTENPEPQPVSTHTPRKVATA